MLSQVELDPHWTESSLLLVRSSQVEPTLSQVN